MTWMWKWMWAGSNRLPRPCRRRALPVSYTPFFYFSCISPYICNHIHPYIFISWNRLSRSNWPFIVTWHSKWNIIGPLNISQTGHRQEMRWDCNELIITVARCFCLSSYFENVHRHLTDVICFVNSVKLGLFVARGKSYPYKHQQIWFAWFWWLFVLFFIILCSRTTGYWKIEGCNTIHSQIYDHSIDAQLQT